MARPTDGNVAKQRSRTALFAHIAARLEGWKYADDGSYFRDVLHVAVNARAGRVAAQAFRESDSAGVPRMRTWLLIDEPAADLDVSLLRFPGDGRPQPDLFEALQMMPGVRQLLQLAGEGDVLAVVIFDGARARRQLRSRLQRELGVTPSWQEVERESWQPAVGSWRALAQDAAAAEGLRLG